MTSQAGHHGGGSQLHPNQVFVKIKAVEENVLGRLWALFQIPSSICFWRKLLFLFSMAFMLIHAHGEEQTGICRKLGVDPEMVGCSPCSSTEQLPMEWMNVCIPHVHRNIESHSPDPLGPPSPSKANVKIVAVMILATIGGIGLAGRVLYKRWRAFTEADINRGLMSDPAVPKRSDPTFEIHLSID